MTRAAHGLWMLFALLFLQQSSDIDLGNLYEVRWRVYQCEWNFSNYSKLIMVSPEAAESAILSPEHKDGGLTFFHDGSAKNHLGAKNDADTQVDFYPLEISIDSSQNPVHLSIRGKGNFEGDYYIQELSEERLILVGR